MERDGDNRLRRENVSSELVVEPTIPGVSVPSASGGNRLETFDQHRSLLFGIAYRMLGSVADAEDTLQEAFIRWEHASPVDVDSPKAWLVTIVTRLCINHQQSARVLREEYFGQWLPESIITTPRSNPLLSLEVDESLSLAFLILLERLNPVERAALLLRDVFDYEYSEIARILDQNEVNCRQVLRRARQHIKETRSRFDAPQEQRAELLRRFSEASRNGDMDGLIALLAKDAVFYSDGGGKAPALPKPIRGAANVARGILEGLRRLVPKNRIGRYVEINGRPGIVSYHEDKPFSVFTIDVSEDRVSRVYVITNPDKLKRLPPFTALP